MIAVDTVRAVGALLTMHALVRAPAAPVLVGQSVRVMSRVCRDMEYLAAVRRRLIDDSVREAIQRKTLAALWPG